MNTQDIGAIIIILCAYLSFMYWILRGYYRRYKEIKRQEYNKNIKELISNRKGN